MRTLIQNGIEHPSAIDFHDRLGGHLRAADVDAVVQHGRVLGDLSPYDLLVTNVEAPAQLRSLVPTFGGMVMPRPGSMSLLALGGLDCMRWSTARTTADVAALFDRWGVDRLLLKRSFSYGGDGTDVVARPHVAHLAWSPHHDLFCAEVDPGSGDVHKAELFHDELLLSWVSAAPPLADQWDGEVLHGIRGAYGERRLHEFPSDVVASLTAVGGLFGRLGLGHVSIDLMLDPDGTYRAIEVNLSMVATWWTGQFDQMLERYAAAIARLDPSLSSTP